MMPRRHANVGGTLGECDPGHFSFNSYGGPSELGKVPEGKDRGFEESFPETCLDGAKGGSGISSIYLENGTSRDLYSDGDCTNLIYTGLKFPENYRLIQLKSNVDGQNGKMVNDNIESVMCAFT
ncbi:uncharacterized protein N7477_005847 [Penicillium maclennaniae]|uniref:uncharacterized protein n=1 Tax=Penicillium maclennaniae TaxID=1343394 RepID=UPI00253FC052|nr:uncharacterized protein N7477_005847 [Penicillium maclennaniae]KAJ5670484.1 hypothetical protein N7477_005847 [Penicillium maclennaniae]